MKTILVDDFRNMDVDKICRNYQSGKLAIMQDKYDVLYLDHDLGEYHTGYDFIKWCIRNKCTPKKVYIVSSNPVGRDNIGYALKSDGYIQKTPYYFISK
jgi:hypothetical protein